MNSVRPKFIATDNRSEPVIRLAHNHDIPLFRGNPRESRLIEFLVSIQTGIDLVLSINYLFLIDESSLNSLPLAINFHGSLLPKYRGRTPHVWAIINNEKKTGVTAHIIDKNCDTGAIVKQREININNTDTGADILDKFREIYPVLIKETLDEFSKGILKSTTQIERKATYFGKRTPEDGLINWNWQKERIYNWIRAQAAPYPGAFTTIGDKKVIIDQVEFSDIGFSGDDRNGLVLAVKPHPIVKCPNGAIALTVVRNKSVLKELEKGKIFGL